MPRPVNNELYSTLGDRWYDADDDPVALLRAECRLRNPWVIAQIATRSGPRRRVLDIGCGAGFLTNPLALAGHDVDGLDASAEAMAVAAARDTTGRVRYQPGDAAKLPYPDAHFDVVCAMDLLEHVEEPRTVVAEAARVLRADGLFFFHTFNRSWWSWLIAIKGVEWFVRNTPPDMHVLHLFIKPGELAGFCADSAMDVQLLQGSRPVVNGAFFRMLATRTVPRDFRFRFTASTMLGYTGIARKRPAS